MSASDVSMPQELSENLVEIRRQLHRIPEIGFEEHNTSAYIRSILEKHGLAVKGPIAGTGLWVDIAGAAAGPAVGYRADIDALPARDAKTVPYASSIPGAAHLCGHDAHTAVAIGVALLLAQERNSLAGTVRVFFQPNEEGTPGGAVKMIEEGILDGLEAVYAVHVDPTLESGRYGLRSGAITAGNDQFRVIIRSPSSGHSARPHETVDTIWTATQVANSLYQLVGRITDARNPSVLTICRFHGGDAFNVIPAEAEFGGTLRSTNPDDRSLLLDQIEKTARQVADLCGASAEVKINSGSPPLNNDTRLIEHLENVVRELFGQKAVYYVPRPSMGAEDFAHFLRRVPGALLRVGTSSGPETSHPLHDSLFDIDESTLAPTARLMASVLSRHLERRVLH